MPRLVDHAAGRPGAQAVRDAGFDGAVRYLANSPDRGLPNKILTPEEAREYLDRKMFLVSNWQKGKNASADWRRGERGGIEDASAALAHHIKCGGPTFAPIYFSIDEDVTAKVWNDLCAPYLRGVHQVIGKPWTGVYGGLRSMWYALEDDLVGRNAAGRPWLWQTRAWSSYDPNTGKWNNQVYWHPEAVLRQERIDQDRVAGIGIDINTTWADDFGQWNIDRTPKLSKNDEQLLGLVLEQMMGPKP